MNYRHAFHAGNHADVLKHIVLVLCLEYMTRKAGPISVFDAHAGRGLYDLTGEEAQRSPEWQNGAARIFDWPDAPPALAPFQQALRRLNAQDLRVYPGSPWLAAWALRAQDSLSLCELHPQDCLALRRVIAPDGQSLQRRADVHERNAYEALRALLPLPHKRALILIDPPYERSDDFQAAAKALRQGLQRVRQGVFLWWRPLKDAGQVDSSDGEVQAEGQFPFLRVDLAVRNTMLPGLGASSLLILNPPYPLEGQLSGLLPALCARLAQGPGASWHISRSG